MQTAENYEMEGDEGVAEKLRAGAIVQPFRYPSDKPRLAWRPWLRGFVLGAVLGAALVFGYFLWRMATMPDWAVPARYGGK